VLDYVAHSRVKTPTAAAAFIIDHQAEEATLLDELYQRITRTASERILREKQRLERQQAVLPLLITNIIQGRQNRLTLLLQRMTSFAAQRLEREPARLQLLHHRLFTSGGQLIEREQHRLQLMKQRLESLDPRLLLKRGYTITTCGGKLVRSAEGLAEGEVLTTQTEKGNIYSIVKVVKMGSYEEELR
jgi:exodeoxyribonuclease VII large subunit